MTREQGRNASAMTPNNKYNAEYMANTKSINHTKTPTLNVNHKKVNKNYNIPLIKGMRPPKPYKPAFQPQRISPNMSVNQSRNLCDFTDGIDSVEQERHIERLKNANLKQNHIFEHFMKKYYIPKEENELRKRHIENMNDNMNKIKADRNIEK